jgi:Rad3-related DNA helicase
MNLQLRGAVILLDEAHNIEDCCRDAGSYSVSYEDIFHSMKDCKRVESMQLLPEVHNNLVQNHYYSSVSKECLGCKDISVTLKSSNLQIKIN